MGYKEIRQSNMDEKALAHCGCEESIRMRDGVRIFEKAYSEAGGFEFFDF